MQHVLLTRTAPTKTETTTLISRCATTATGVSSRAGSRFTTVSEGLRGANLNLSWRQCRSSKTCCAKVLDVKKAATDRQAPGLGTIGHTELLQQPRHVKFHRTFSDM